MNVSGEGELERFDHHLRIDPKFGLSRDDGHDERSLLLSGAKADADWSLIRHQLLHEHAIADCGFDPEALGFVRQEARFVVSQHAR